MDLVENQKQAIRQWAQEGCGLSELQKKILAQFGISMTYMDVRLLILDLGIKLQEKSKPADTSLAANAPASSRVGQTTPESKSPWPNAGAASGGVSVGIDRVTTPGSVVSGTVTFSDGVSATWFLDQLGRLALNPGKPGYAPSQQDVQSFQRELKSALSKMGY